MGNLLTDSLDQELLHTGFCVLRRGKACRLSPVPLCPLAPSFPAPRSGQVFPDEAEHFSHNRDASVATPEVFGFIPESPFGFAGILSLAQSSINRLHFAARWTNFSLTSRKKDYRVIIGKPK